MKDEWILKKAIEKAVKGGYIFFLKDSHPDYIAWTITSELLPVQEYYKLIFSHSFAKAFWRNLYVCHNCGFHPVSLRINIAKEGYYCPQCKVLHKHETITEWQYHLQQMVLEEQPLKYIERYLTPQPQKG